jgi:hypothetical protein
VAWAECTKTGRLGISGFAAKKASQKCGAFFLSKSLWHRRLRLCLCSSTNTAEGGCAPYTNEYGGHGPVH